jgi:predicted enzyme related to lactoylglutathione lyase
MRTLAWIVLLMALPAMAAEHPWVESPGAPALFAVDVNDLDTAIDWYSTTFGAGLLDDTSADDGRWRIANLRSEGLAIELIRDRRSTAVEQGVRHHGLRKVGVSVPDVRAVADRVEADTGERPRVIEDERHGIRLIQLHDPEGNTIQLQSPLGADPDDRQVLLQMHRDVFRFHLENDLDSWMADESEDYIDANRGEISRPSIAERRAQLQPYLAATSFTDYRDLVEPEVRVSNDGSMGWVVCQVEVNGKRGDEEFSSVWAWIELYARQDGEWKRVGNVSNRRE